MADKLSRAELSAKFRELTGNKKPDLSKKSEPKGKGLAIGYTRVSTSKQADEGQSLDTQTTRIERYCDMQNLQLTKIHTDGGLSGMKRNRPGLNSLLDELLPGMKVVVTDIDRIARDTEHLLEVKRIIHEKKCSLFIINRNLDTANPNSEFVFTIFGAIAKQEHNLISQRTRAALQDRKAKGLLKPRARFGWKYQNGVLTEIPEQQVIIALIKDFIKESPNISNGDIRRKLISYNIIHNNKPVDYKTISRIIENNNLRKIEESIKENVIEEHSTGVLPEEDKDITCL